MLARAARGTLVGLLEVPGLSSNVVGEAGFESPGERHEVKPSGELASPASEETAAKVTGNYADDRALTKLVTVSGGLFEALERAVNAHDRAAAVAVLDRLRVLVLADKPNEEGRTRFDRVVEDEGTNEA